MLNLISLAPCDLKVSSKVFDHRKMITLDFNLPYLSWRTKFDSKYRDKNNQLITHLQRVPYLLKNTTILCE